MATQAQMDRLIGRALADDEFRGLLLADPANAALKLRIKLDPQQVERIHQMDPTSADGIARDFQAFTLGGFEALGFW